MNRLPFNMNYSRHCTKCGSRVLFYRTYVGFSPSNGQREYVIGYKCPNLKWYKPNHDSQDLCSSPSDREFIDKRVEELNSQKGT